MQVDYKTKQQLSININIKIKSQFISNSFNPVLM